MTDKRNILNLLVYIIDRVNTKDFHNVLKVLYWAEQEHLAKYGLRITSGNYIAMPKGPVHQDLYSMIQAVNKNFADSELKEFFKVTGKYGLKSLKKADLNYISESEKECINNAIRKSDSLSFDQRTKASHDLAWKNGRKSSTMNIKDIAKVGGANNELIKHIVEQSEWAIV